MPVRGDSSSKIESLPGGTFTGDIDDVKYLRDKLFSALKVPQSYLSRGEGADEDKSTLAQKDIRFARTIQRLQRSALSEISKIGIIHLYTLGFRGDDLVGFTLSLNNPSKIAELQELEHWRTKFDVAQGATDAFFSKRWIASHIFGLTDDEIIRMQREMFFDKKLTAELEAVAEGGGSDMGGDFDTGDDDLDLGDDDLDLGDDDLDLGADDTDAADDAGEDDVLLTAPPGRRSDNVAIGEKYTTPGAKGKVYKKRGQRGHKAAARNYSMDSHAGGSKRSTGVKNVVPGLEPLSSLANGVFESKATNYKEDENKILQVSHELRNFAESLTTKKEPEKQ